MVVRIFGHVQRGGALDGGVARGQVAANANASFETCGYELQHCEWGNDRRGRCCRLDAPCRCHILCW